MTQIETTKSKDEADKRIPKLTDKEVVQLYAKIKPVVKGTQIGKEKLSGFINKWAEEQKSSGEEFASLKKEAGDRLYWITDVNPKNVAFTWEAIPIGVAAGLKELRCVTTYHTYSYYGFFKPSVYEVLAQIPGDIKDRVVAFQTEANGERITDDVLTSDQKYHKGKTTFYALEDGGVRTLLRGEGKNWSARKEERDKVDMIERKKAEIEALGKEVMKFIEDISITTYSRTLAGENEEQVSAYSCGIFEDFGKLLEYYPNLDEVNELRKNTLKRVLGTLNKELKSGELNVLKAGVVLEQLGDALVRKDDTFGMDGMSSLRQYDYWGEEAQKLAKGVLVIVNERFLGGSMADYMAESMIKQVKHFIPTDPANQLLLMEVTKPVLEATIKRWHLEDRKETAMSLIRKNTE
jgi:hypothetical protein